MKTWLFNPFKFIAGGKALLYGIIGIIITTILCLLSKEHLDGVVDVHAGRETPPYFYFIEPVIDWLCLVIPLYIFGRAFSASAIRFIDVAGTSALARYPMLFVVLLTMLTPKNIGDPQKIMTTIQTNHAIMARLVIVGLMALPFIVWSVTLMYNAYSVSANLKGPKAGWSFTISIVVAEIFSKIIITSLI